MLTLPLYTKDSTMTELDMMYASTQVNTRAACLSLAVQGFGRCRDSSGQYGGRTYLSNQFCWDFS